MASVCTKTGFHLMDENTPLNVELRPCIESHFKCTIMNVKIVFRLGFGVKIQNLPGSRFGKFGKFGNYCFGISTGRVFKLHKKGKDV